MIKCPCCHGVGIVEQTAPVKLTTTEQKIYDIVRESKNGIDGPALVGKVYADREDGGPEFAFSCLHVTVHRMNKKLLLAKQRVRATHKGIGGKFYVEQLA